MKTEIENLHGHFKKISIEVPADIVAQHFDSHFKSVQKQAELKGFRKGKAPLQVVKQLYGSSAGNYVARSLVEDHLFKALEEHSLEPIGMPKVEAGAPLEGVPFKFSAEFENLPPINLKTYTGLKLSRGNGEVSDTELNATLEKLRSQLATASDAGADAQAAAGMIASMDYEASEAGAPVPEASEKDGSVELGEGQLFEGFEKQVLGMKVGETKNFTVSFPKAEDEQSKTPVSGRTLDFTVTLKALKQKKLPELNDDFAKQIGPFQGLEDLKKRVLEDLKMNKTNQEKRQHQEKYVEWLIEQNPVDTPETMLNSQMEQLAMDAGMQLSRMGLDEKAIEERLKQWGPSMQERAVRQVKASLLLSAIAQKENIQANDEDLRKELVRMSSQMGKSPQDIWEDMQKRNLARGFIKQLTELKALDWAVAKAEQG